ncbi:MAG: 2Fe-2S iron-sulfur cluster-binding protein [Hyphomicrobiaceae bacterium]|nr:2Fe-2S iron-sulfur cluster-binding protein [Hyphomicrobiaceae bacterium]
MSQAPMSQARTSVARPSSSLQPFRLAEGGIVDRSRVLLYSFDGAPLQGHLGDTLASALLASGVRLTGRSFKYHRPRGILSAGSEEPSALVELRRGDRREANTRATVAELYDGLVAQSQNRWPSLRYDAMAINQVFAPLFVAGFYYKTFMWPAALWERLYEPAIRRAAGLGRAAGGPDPDHYEKLTAFADVLVIGGGASGLAAALAAARAGERVILCDEQAHPGGRAIDDGRMVGGRPALDGVLETLAELSSDPRVRILPRTTVFGVYDGRTYGAVERVADHVAVPPADVPRQRLWRIIAKRAVLAAGATERGIIFADNDRPGVMLAGAVRSYIHRYGVLPGRRAVVFTNNDDGMTTARALATAGGHVVAVVDARSVSAASAATAPAPPPEGEHLLGAVVVRALGGTEVSGALVRLASGEERTIACDLIAVSGGWSPNLHLSTHLGGKPAWDDAIAAFRPGEALPPGMTAVGRAAGVFAAADRPYAITPMWQVPPAAAKGWRKPKAFVDLQHDVTDEDIQLAAREGFDHAEHLKRYTTLGMATDQGRTSALPGIAVLSAHTGRSLPETGLTTARPPYTPVSIGALAGTARGAHFRPVRRPPTYAWARQCGASFVETGLWLRAAYFPEPGDRDWYTAARREVEAVRTAVGISDVSTLGKIDVRGRDAAAFLDRIYCNTMSSLAIGRVRYGVMLREDGIVLDDGTAARFSDGHFVVTTTTANAARVMQHLEVCHQTLWPALDVTLASVTDHWAQIAIAGPRARDLLARVVDRPFDIANTAFLYMAAAEVGVCGGTPARLFRVSFSGELGFELAVPARFGQALMERLLVVGADLGVRPYGAEALGILRIEKGHVAGAELNGTTTAADLGLGGLMSRKKEYIGRLLAERPGLVAADRQVLVGLRPADRSARIRSGAHLVARNAKADAASDIGYVTSAAQSPTLGHAIALALMARGRERHGEIVRAVSPLTGEDVEVEVTSPVFYDPEGARLRG